MQAVDGFKTSGRSLLVRQENAKLVMPSGESIKGVNLGGWLVTENWMNGVSDASDAASGRHVLAQLSA
jgi:hypothetical protein